MHGFGRLHQRTSWNLHHLCVCVCVYGVCCVYVCVCVCVCGMCALCMCSVCVRGVCAWCVCVVCVARDEVKQWVSDQMLKRNDISKSSHVCICARLDKWKWHLLHTRTLHTRTVHACTVSTQYHTWSGMHMCCVYSVLVWRTLWGMIFFAQIHVQYQCTGVLYMKTKVCCTVMVHVASWFKVSLELKMRQMIISMK